MQTDKVILIFSQEVDDTTDTVIDWISYYNYPFLRINPTDLTRLKFDLDLSNSFFQIEDSTGKILNSKSIHSIWFRRMHPLNILNDKITDQNDLIELNTAKRTELFNLYASFEYCLQDKYWINKYSDIKVSKIYQLICASKVGLLIPATHITNNKDSLETLSASGNTLSKALDYMLIMNNYASYSSRITDETMKKIPDTFFPSQIQTEIEKEIELRIVFLEGIFYTMAIFSQQNSQTQVDFRKYDFDFPNRTIRYNLPDSIKTKLLKLMKKLGLNFGSIDMIKAKNGEYYFLEVNPVGQFGMVSYPCNFNIEKKLAELLISRNEKSN